jgi:hypothetical protein
MASVSVEGDEFRVRLTAFERLAAMRGDVVMPVASVAGVRKLDRALDALRGIRAPGTGLPGVLSDGTRRGSFGRDFVAVFGRGPGVVIELRDAPFKQLVLSVADADSVRELVQAAAPS